MAEKLHKKHFEGNHNVTSNQAKTNMTIMTGHNLQSYSQNIRSHCEQHHLENVSHRVPDIIFNQEPP